MAQKKKKPERPASRADKSKKEASGQGDVRKGSAKNRQSAPLASRRFPVVGIGASAGGLQALEMLFQDISDESGAAYIVAQHLSPERHSIMDKILARSMEMPVLEAKDGMGIKPNTVYVKPSEMDIEVKGETIVQVKSERTHLNMPIDRLFRSLALEMKERAACVILSGTGSDGSQGLKEIKSAGGLVIVQDPNEATYKGMPQSAQETGLYDFILPLRKIPRALASFFNHPYARQHIETNELDENLTRKVLKIVLSKTGHDFSKYKLSTVNRRIERRQAINAIPSLSDYIKYLRQTPSEAEALFKDLVIHVTSFFRDTEAYAALKEMVVTPLVIDAEQDKSLRIWVPGCATGEEAYSIAMIFLEVMEEQKKRIKLKIFGTDINADSLKVARDGIYPQNIADDISSQRLKRFFSVVDGKYKIERWVRERLIFSEHSIVRDPPFSRVNLISCRNLLIYMDSNCQKRMLSLFHYALAPGGCLFLGTSEGVGTRSDLFYPLSKKWKIFKAEEENFQRRNDFSMVSQRRRLKQTHDEEAKVSSTSSRDKSARTSQDEDMLQVMEQAMLAHYGPMGVLVDQDNSVIYFHGDTSRFFRMPQGKPRYDILDLIRPELHATLKNGLAKVRQKNRKVSLEGLRSHGNRQTTLDIVLLPFAGQKLLRNLILIIFREYAAESGESEDLKETLEETDLTALQRELDAARQDLQASIEELETANEELKSANEELQANNEELQSTNEELDTSREELQSTNEELETLNTELQKKNEELESANDDIRNMFEHTNIGTIVLDTDLRVKRFSPSATKLFSLIDKDVGRPITDITSRLQYDTLEEDTRGVLETLNSREKELSSRGGRWYAMSMFPYRSSDNIIEGVVINFLDVTELKKVEVEAQEARIQAEAILETTRQPLLVLDGSLTVVTANRAFYNVFNVDRMHSKGRRIYDLGEGQWNSAKLKKLLEDIIPKNTVFHGFEIEQDFFGSGRKTLLLDARRIDMQGGQPKLILVGFSEKKGEDA